MQRTYTSHSRGKDSKVNFLLKCSGGIKKISTFAPENSTLTEFVKKLPGADLKRDENLKAHYLVGLEGMELGDGGIQFYIVANGKKGLPMVVDGNGANENEVMFPGMDDTTIKGEVEVIIQVDDFKNDPTIPGCKGRMPKQDEKVELEKCQVYTGQEGSVVTKQAKQYLPTAPSSTSSSPSTLIGNNTQQHNTQDNPHLKLNPSTNNSFCKSSPFTKPNLIIQLSVPIRKIYPQATTDIPNPNQKTTSSQKFNQQIQQPQNTRQTSRPQFNTQQFKSKFISSSQDAKSGMKSSITKIKYGIRSITIYTMSKITKIKTKFKTVLSNTVNLIRGKLFKLPYPDIAIKIQTKLAIVISKLSGIASPKIRESLKVGWFRDVVLNFRYALHNLTIRVMSQTPNNQIYLYVLACMLVLTTLAFCLFS